MSVRQYQGWPNKIIVGCDSLCVFFAHAANLFFFLFLCTFEGGLNQIFFPCFTPSCYRCDLLLWRGKTALCRLYVHTVFAAVLPDGDGELHLGLQYQRTLWQMGHDGLFLHHQGAAKRKKRREQNIFWVHKYASHPCLRVAHRYNLTTHFERSFWHKDRAKSSIVATWGKMLLSYFLFCSCCFCSSSRTSISASATAVNLQEQHPASVILPSRPVCLKIFFFKKSLWEKRVPTTSGDVWGRCPGGSRYRPAAADASTAAAPGLWAPPPAPGPTSAWSPSAAAASATQTQVLQNVC